MEINLLEFYAKINSNVKLKAADLVHLVDIYYSASLTHLAHNNLVFDRDECYSISSTLNYSRLLFISNFNLTVKLICTTATYTH